MSPLRERLGHYARLMRLHRPVGILLLLWPTLWALWIAGAGRPDPFIVTVFMAGVVLMRSAGCVINDYADRHFDPQVARTRDRPLASGLVTAREALVLFAVLCLLAFALVLTQNRLTIQISFAALALAIVYPFTKRVTQLPQLVLGAAFGMAIPMAFAAETGAVPSIAWWLFAANLAWTVAYDTLYAMVDRADDVKIGVKSTAILFGTHDRLIVGLLQLLALTLLSLAGQQLHLGNPYALGLLAAAALALWQQWLVRDRNPARCFAAFLNNQWFGAAVFVGLALDYALA
jgi:4-hydroxybenzoate polyprenyltransferase